MEEPTAAEEQADDQDESEEEVKEPSKKRQKVSAADEDSAVQMPKVGGIKKIEDKRPFTDQEAEQTIAEWMEKQNRPYSVQDLLNNFQH